MCREASGHFAHENTARLHDGTLLRRIKFIIYLARRACPALGRAGPGGENDYSPQSRRDAEKGKKNKNKQTT